MVRETYGDYVLDFFYDQNGTPFMLLQNGNIYYYITNAQGDVIRLVDINGNSAASYRYDPYGKATSALGSHANINPLRYRGYVFDHETGLYYLQSRYYDPETGRFINADALVSTGQGLLGYNMVSYCLNNPINKKDRSGTQPVDITYNCDVITITVTQEGKLGPIVFVIVIEGEFDWTEDVTIPVGDYLIALDHEGITVSHPTEGEILYSYTSTLNKPDRIKIPLFSCDEFDMSVALSKHGVGIMHERKVLANNFSVAIYADILATLNNIAEALPPAPVGGGSGGGGGAGGIGHRIYWSRGGGSFYMPMRNPTMQFI